MSLATPVIAGNWKMHMGPEAAASFFLEFLPLVPDRGRGTVAFFPPAISLAASLNSASDRDDIRFGVQNIHWEEKGAFTGEISGVLAAEAGATLTLVGHSERRHVFGETGEQTRKKVDAALAAGLVPVLCVGELLEEREAGHAAEVVEAQLREALPSLDEAQARRILLAYEPVWAIGTGRTASPADAEQMHGRIRAWLVDRAGAQAAAAVPILYGGSVKPDNARELLATPDVDGLLVGGASLEPAGFARICASGA
jgi:triosephosphate isomerase (TIM)